MVESLEARARRLAAAASIEPVEVVSYEERSQFGDGEVVLCVNGILLKIVRDRGQEFLDVASICCPEKFYQFDDVEIAMGWRAIEDVLAKTEPEPLEQVLERLGTVIAELREKLSGDQERFTRARLEHATKERGVLDERSLQ